MMWPHGSPGRTPTHISVLPRVRISFRYLKTLQDFSPKSFFECVSAFLHSQYPTEGSFVEGRGATCRPFFLFCSISWHLFGCPQSHGMNLGIERGVCRALTCPQLIVGLGFSQISGVFHLQVHSPGIAVTTSSPAPSSYPFLPPSAALGSMKRVKKWGFSPL